MTKSLKSGEPTDVYLAAAQKILDQLDDYIAQRID
jgi:hypothetical protein